ncbi:hypothetical protein Baya_1272 [Bagarius yarrelli]|uniref:Uncharacterized protein n=1 Tax=Bagarius yarrelli TaxID=175774 RepID=A0A556TKM3_BAGYA|nr:hypothetical protein Baya_1272 [Bagarius yarrelli]
MTAANETAVLFTQGKFKAHQDIKSHLILLQLRQVHSKEVCKKKCDDGQDKVMLLGFEMHCAFSDTSVVGNNESGLRKKLLSPGFFESSEGHGSPSLCTSNATSLCVQTLKRLQSLLTQY